MDNSSTIENKLGEDIFTCKEHNKIFELFCEEPLCNVLICNMCSFDKHKDHNAKPIHISTESIRGLIQNKFPLVNDISMKMSRNIECLRNCIQAIQQEKIEAQEKVKSEIHEIRKLLNMRENQLLDEIEQFSNKILSDIEKECEALTSISFSTQHTIASIQKLILETNTNNNPSVSMRFLNNTKEYIDQIEKISTFKWENKVNKTKPLHPFIKFHPLETNEIDLFVAKVGKVEVNDNQNNQHGRDYKKLTPGGKHLCKRVYGPDLGENFGKLTNPRYITIIPKELFTNTNNIIIENYNNNSNNDANNSNFGEGSSSHSDSNNNNNNKRTQPNDDVLVVSDTRNNRILLIEKTSGRVHSIIGGKFGNELGEFNNPISTIVVKHPFTQKLILMVADFKNNRIQLFDIETGKYFHHFENENHLQNPNGIAINPKTGDLVISNWGNNTLTVHKGFNSLATNNISKSNMNINNNNDLNNNNNINNSDMELKNSNFGELIRVIGESFFGVHFKYPNRIVVNSKGNIIVSCEHKINIFDTDYKLLKTFGSKGENNGEFNELYGLAVDEFDNILVCDSKNDRVQIFDSEGKWVHTFGKHGSDESSFDGPNGITVDFLTGTLFVIDSNNHRILAF